MGEISDIEQLLAKAKRHATLVAWLKVGVISLCTLVGSAFGAGMTAARYLDQLMTKDQAAKLYEGQQSVIDGHTNSIKLVVDRVASCEQVNGFQDRRQDELRADLKDLAARSGVLVKGRP